MKIRTLVIPVVLLVALAGCTSNSVGQPNPSVSSSSTAPAPSSEPTAGPTTAAVALPASCEALVSTATIQREFSPSFNPTPYVAHPENTLGQEFTDRGGLICLWSIPQSEGFVAIYVAERATATDADQIAAWRGAGFADCSPLVDACFFEEEETMVGMMSTVYTLAGGFELRLRTSAGSLSPLRAVVQEAATNMGYV